MTTAREQAREAVNALLPTYEPTAYEDVLVEPDLAADAASDVWEPLLRDLVKVAEDLRVRANDGIYDYAIAAAKEALG